MPEEFTDEELLLLLKQESSREKAFGVLVKKIQEPIYWEIRRLTQNHEDTNDVLQNVFVKVWNNIENFKGDSKIYTWVYRIARNESINFVNKNAKQRTQNIDEPLIHNKLFADSSQMDGKEIQDVLQKAIDDLPEKQQQVFKLKYFDELKYSEISKLLDTSEGGLKASYHHAVKKIEQFLKDHIKPLQ